MLGKMGKKKQEVMLVGGAKVTSEVERYTNNKGWLKRSSS